MNFTQIKENVFYLGSADKDRALFDQLIPLPDGTSYNVYLVKGSEKTALIDTVYPSKQEELVNKLTQVDKIDYIISNHAEQDHSGSIPKILEMYPDAKVVTNSKCKDLLICMLQVSEDKIIVVNTGDSISLGDKTLEFTVTPWVHWPDTMFTYLKEDKVLFSCDFLGAHLADELYITDKEYTYKAAKRYYAEIMMPFRIHVKKHLETVTKIQPDIIAPSHGPVYTDPSFILDAYKDWSSDEVKNAAVIVYVSMYESTKKMVEYLTESLTAKGINVKVFDLVSTDTGELAMELVDAATLVIGSSTVLAGPHPHVASAAYLINALRPKTRYAAIIGSYGWGGNMVEQLKNFISNLKVELFEPVVVKGCPRTEDFQKLDMLSENIALRHKGLK